MNKIQQKAYDKLIQIVTEKGGKITGEYINTSVKVEIECDKGHTWNASPHHVKNGSWCPTCAGRCPIEAKKKFYNIVEEKKGKVIGEYIDTKTKIEIECENGHTWNVKPNEIKQGSWCPRCLKNCPIKAQENLYKIVNEKNGKILGKYVNSQTKIQFECSQGHQWEAKPNGIIQGTWCSKCSGNCPIQAKEIFFELIKEKGGNVIGEYKNVTTKIKIKCGNEHTWDVTPHQIMASNSWCPVCIGHCPIQAKQKFYNIMQEKKGKVIGEYFDTKIKIEVECENGHQWSVPPDRIIQGAWCMKCYGNCPEQAKEKFYEIVKEKGGKIIDEYKGGNIKIEIECKNKHKWIVTPSSINSGSWCWKCLGTHPEQSKEKLYKIVEEKDGKVLGEYINALTKIEIQCKKGHNWFVVPNSITNAEHWCSTCNEYKGERRLRTYLEKLNVNFQGQFPAKIKGRNLRFDFYAEIDDKKILFEFDGEQHFELCFLNDCNEDKLQDQHKRDYLKTKWALNNGYFLIRIDYNNRKNIETFLDSILEILDTNNLLILSDKEIYIWLINMLKEKV